jgi:hypothetical protein
LFGDSRPSLAVTGLIHTGDHSRERADCREVGEAVGVAEASSGLVGVDPKGPRRPSATSQTSTNRAPTIAGPEFLNRATR